MFRRMTILPLLVLLAAPPAGTHPFNVRDMQSMDRVGDTHVSPDGNAAWSGRLAKPNAGQTDGPMASLAGARDAIRKLKAQGAVTKPIRVLVADGLYSLTEPLVFTPEDSGTDAAPVTYEAARGARRQRRQEGRRRLKLAPASPTDVLIR